MFVGSSPIVIIEAAYQRSLGKLVLMVDESDGIGGSWRPLKLFGIHGVENAIHYFLYDSNAFHFMKRNLKLNVIHSIKKYRVIPNFFGANRILPYDSVVGRFLAAYLGYLRRHTEIVSVCKALFLILKRPLQRSNYLKGGCVELITTLRKLIINNGIKIFLNTKIIKYDFNDAQNKITLELINLKNNKNMIVFSKKIFITHGSKINHIFSSFGVLTLKKRLLLRPSLHLLINNCKADLIHELIFTKHPLIKYVHDVSGFTKKGSKLKGKKILVVALQHKIRFYDGLLDDILFELKKFSMVSDNAFVESSHWQDIFLPSINDSDLKMLQRKFPVLVECLFTDDLTKGIAFNSKRWSTKINNF